MCIMPRRARQAQCWWQAGSGNGTFRMLTPAATPTQAFAGKRALHYALRS